MRAQPFASAGGTSTALTFKVHRTVIGAVRIVGPGRTGDVVQVDDGYRQVAAVARYQRS